jgi:hypothetical protein
MLTSTEKCRVWIRQSIESFSIIKTTLDVLGIHMIYKHCAEEIQHQIITLTGKYSVQNH